MATSVKTLNDLWSMIIVRLLHNIKNEYTNLYIFFKKEKLVFYSVAL